MKKLSHAINIHIGRLQLQSRQGIYMLQVAAGGGANQDKLPLLCSMLKASEENRLAIERFARLVKHQARICERQGDYRYHHPYLRK
jgi:hypothetical protein